jgi:hypothetical protein
MKLFRRYYYYYHLTLFAVSKSAVDASRDIIAVPQTIWGTAIIFRNEWAACITAVKTDDPRLYVI